MNTTSLPTQTDQSAEPDAGSSAIKSPAEIKADIPRSDSAERTVARSRREIEQILSGDDQRLLVICGPCSIHDINASIEYATRLAKLAHSVKGQIKLVMRTYFEKPRSVVGWKGFVYDPDLAGSFATHNGLVIARRLLARVNEMGLPCATEFLNPVIAPYLEDLIAYGAIGARTSESQIHRELASRLPLPIGMKNDMQGDVQSAVNAIKSANQPHSVFSVNEQGAPAIIRSQGNPFAHAFLRGGRQSSNIEGPSIRKAADRLSSSALRRPVMLDCSHSNSQKDYRNQGPNARLVTDLFMGSHPEIAGLMLESNLLEGSQNFQAGGAHAYGQSITDSCIGWDETETLILEIARKLKTRRNR